MDIVKIVGSIVEGTLEPGWGQGKERWHENGSGSVNASKALDQGRLDYIN